MSARQRAQRFIALVEAAKGVGALAASIGLLGLLHRDLSHIVSVLIGHFGLDPGGHYPEVLLQYATMLQDTSLRTLVALAGGYVIVRLAEAYGLWRDRAWGEWLGALSGGIYVPFELRHLVHRPSVLAVAVVLFNVGIVAFLVWQLWRRGKLVPHMRR
ncbi:tmRNA [Bordetella sp. H567]|nr:tmRNA [Bordetella sp. H567]